MRKQYFFDVLGALVELIINWCWPLVAAVAMKLYMVLIGALFGWIIGWFAGGTILGILAQLGISGFSMMQIGAFLGFIGSFFGSLNFNDFRSNNGFNDFRNNKMGFH